MLMVAAFVVLVYIGLVAYLLLVCGLLWGLFAGYGGCSLCG